MSLRLPRPEKTTLHWILEATLIVVSVAVGFAVTEFRQYWAERALADQVLTGVYEEVTRNLAVLEPTLDKHREWAEALAKVDLGSDQQSAFGVMFGARPGNDVNIGLPLRQAAWDTAVSTGALRLFDYDVAAALSDIYGYQNMMSANLTRLAQSVIYMPSTFDPSSRTASVQVMRWMIAEVEGNERYLRDLYREHLPLLQAAAQR